MDLILACIGGFCLYFGYRQGFLGGVCFVLAYALAFYGWERLDLPGGRGVFVLITAVFVGYYGGVWLGRFLQAVGPKGSWGLLGFLNRWAGLGIGFVLFLVFLGYIPKILLTLALQNWGGYLQGSEIWKLCYPMAKQGMPWIEDWRGFLAFSVLNI